MKLFLALLLLSSQALALPALGGQKSVFYSSFCRQYQCRWIGWNDNFDSFAMPHNCGVDYDVDHYRIGNYAALYQYRLSRTLEQRQKNPVLGFQVQLQFRTDRTRQTERLLERLVLYATGIKTPIRLQKLEQLYGEKLRLAGQKNEPYIEPLVLPIMQKPNQKSRYVLTFDYGRVGAVVFIRFDDTLGC